MDHKCLKNINSKNWSHC